LVDIKSRLNTDQLIAWIKNPVPPMPKVFPEPLNDEDDQIIKDIATYLEKQ
jgi:hypothetical protein